MVELNNILHVEDDPDIQEIANLALEIVGGYHVVQYSCGQDALSKASEFAPDLILLDVMMPELTGPETLERLRKLQGYEDLPVIFMTARAQPDDIEEYMKQGAIAVIVKPFGVATLADEIKGYWEKAIKRSKSNIVPFPTNS